MTSKKPLKPMPIEHLRPMPMKDPAPDPNRCTCMGVQRRYDQDGLVEAFADKPNEYRCAVCGKRYS